MPACEWLAAVDPASGHPARPTPGRIPGVVTVTSWHPETKQLYTGISISIFEEYSNARTRAIMVYSVGGQGRVDGVVDDQNGEDHGFVSPLLAVIWLAARQYRAPLSPGSHSSHPVYRTV